MKTGILAAIAILAALFLEATSQSLRMRRVGRKKLRLLMRLLLAFDKAPFTDGRANR